MKKSIIHALPVLAVLAACNGKNGQADAYGNFEAEEVTVSAKLPGELLVFEITEGQVIEKDHIVGYIDTSDLHLMRLEAEANMGAIRSQYSAITAQVEVLQSKKAILEGDLKRFRKMRESDAVTEKQLDDLEGQLKVVNKEMASIRTQNPYVTAQLEVIKAKLAQIDEKCEKSIIRNPFKGTVITKVSREHELAAPGLPLYTITDLSKLDFRAYVSGSQLSSVKLDDEVRIMVDGQEGDLLEFNGRVKWISDQAEFTPKIIQTKEERVDMVYAVKVEVPNDGSLKMGMPGELHFTEHNAESQ